MAAARTWTRSTSSSASSISCKLLQSFDAGMPFIIGSPGSSIMMRAFPDRPASHRGERVRGVMTSLVLHGMRQFEHDAEQYAVSRLVSWQTCSHRV